MYDSNAIFFKSDFDVFGDCLELTVAFTAANYEITCEGADFPDIE
jgi:hypothetical protein